MVITQFSGIVNEYLMVYPLGVDVFSRKKHEKEPQKAARGAVVFYVAMFQQITSELARLLPSLAFGPLYVREHFVVYPEF